MVDYEELLKFIESQNSWASETKCFDIALFRCWIKFEKFLSHKFVSYSTEPRNIIGEEIRKLKFIDSEHLKAFLRGEKQYIEYIGKIENLSIHIFENNKNPFDLLFTDQKYSNLFKKVRAIRNYIAHESEESKNKYERIVLNNQPYQEPNKYLQGWTKEKDKTYYTYYLDGIKEIAKIINNPLFLFTQSESTSPKKGSSI